MARYQPVERSPRSLPVLLEDQIPPGNFEFVLGHLVGSGLDRRYH